MLIGLAIYAAGLRHLPPDPPRTRGEGRPALTAAEWRQTFALILLIPVLALAIIPNNQIFNAYLVWGDAEFALYWGNTKLPTTWLVTLDAVVSVSFLAIVAGFYRWYGTRWREPDEITKIIIGSAFSVGGMLCLYMAAASQPPGEKIGLFWPVAFHVVNSIGFAHMLPVSLALFAKVAPAAINATVIGLYYLAFFSGNALVGRVGTLYQSMPTPQFWLLHAGLAAGSGFAFLLFKLLMGRRLAAPRPT
jgi:POT family proton-dependent oligopeptide transporter